jgi:hypothetical protein
VKQIARIGEMKNGCKFSIGKPERTTTLERVVRSSKNNIKVDFEHLEIENVE